MLSFNLTDISHDITTPFTINKWKNQRTEHPGSGRWLMGKSACYTNLMTLLNNVGGKSWIQWFTSVIQHSCGKMERTDIGIPQKFTGLNARSTQWQKQEKPRGLNKMKEKVVF